MTWGVEWGGVHPRDQPACPFQVRSTSPVSLTTARAPWRWWLSQLPTRARWPLRPVAPSASRLARASRPSQSRAGACAGWPGLLMPLRPAYPPAPAPHCPPPPPAGDPPSSRTSSLPPQGLPWWGPKDLWPLASPQPSTSLPHCQSAPRAGTSATAPLRWTLLARMPLTTMCCLGAIP